MLTANTSLEHSVNSFSSPTPTPAPSTRSAVASPSITGKRKHFIRVFATRAGASKHTTISFTVEQYAEALKFAYNDASLVNSTVRDTVLKTAPTHSLGFSGAVRDKVLKRLRGNFQPEKATYLSQVALAAENNKAWEQQA